MQIYLASLMHTAHNSLRKLNYKPSFRRRLEEGFCGAAAQAGIFRPRKPCCPGRLCQDAGGLGAIGPASGFAVIT